MCFFPFSTFLTALIGSRDVGTRAVVVAGCLVLGRGVEGITLLVVVVVGGGEIVERLSVV
jgi:hypothetical protein